MNRRPLLNPSIAEMEGYHSPQLDVAVRLNTNEAPEPPPEGLIADIADAVATVAWNRYPDRAATELRAAIADFEGVDPSQVFVANGSNEVLQTLLLAFGGPDRAVLTFEPTYALHSHIAELLGMRHIAIQRDEHFMLSADVAVDSVERNRPAVTFVCSPNNPTGLLEPRSTVEAIVDHTVDGLVIVDEAYGQFAPWSAVELVDDDRPLAVSRTFSKTWSMAASRLGYVVAPAYMVDALFAAVLPYHLDSLKQRIGVLALDYRDEMDARVARLVEQRGRLAVGLGSLAVETWPSAANFLLFRPTEVDADVVWRELVERSILVRNCASWARLDGCLRVTVGTPEENDLFLAALSDILGPRATTGGTPR